MYIEWSTEWWWHHHCNLSPEVCNGNQRVNGSTIASNVAFLHFQVLLKIIQSSLNPDGPLVNLGMSVFGCA